MRTTLLRVVVVLYAVWLAAVVALAASRLGLVPQHPAIRWTVVAGGAVATVVGAVRLARRLYATVSARVRREDGS